MYPQTRLDRCPRKDWGVDECCAGDWTELTWAAAGLLSEVAATLLDQSVNGVEKETLLHEDLVRIGQKLWRGEG